MIKRIRTFISIQRLIVGSILLIVFIALTYIAPLVLPTYHGKDGEEHTPGAASSFAHYKFVPTDGQLVTGTAQNILAQTAATAEGVNLGSWRALLGDDALHWGFASTTSGYNAQVIIGGAQLNGANTLVIQTEIDEDATAPATVVQICDFVSSTNVDHAASGNCSTGGWRTLNNRQGTIAPTTSTNYSWSIYNGYFDNGSATLSNPVSTPLSNFLNGSNQVVVRYYSTTNTTSVVHIDYLRVFAVVSPVYFAADSTVITGTEAGNYTDITVMTQGGGTDTQYSGITGTASVVPDMYWTFSNVKTYTGMNTILLRARHLCSGNTAANTYRFKIYNFNSTAWEDMTTTSIACSTTAANNYFAKNNTTVSNYINGSNEIRVGIYGLAAYANTLRVDGMYVMLGTTNTSTSDCEITMGSASTGDCSNTRTIDTTATISEWVLAPETESTTESHDFYPGDHDMDATVSEVAQAAHMKFNMTKPNTGYVVGIGAAFRVQPRTVSTTGTQSYELRDYQSQSLSTSRNGFLPILSSSAATYTFSETYISSAATYTCGIIGCYYGGGVSYVDTYNNQVWWRTATSADGTNASSNSGIDFVMLSFFWTEDTGSLTERHVFTPTAESIVTGTQPSNCSQCAVDNTNGVEIGGGWQALLADDGAHMGITSTTSGYDAQVTVGGVSLNGANMMMIETELELDATIPQTLVQICDWVSSTGVDNAASGGCTTGGWRTLNYRDAVWNSATATQFHWQIWDGYWSNGSNVPYSTPLSNFVNGSNNVLIRYYSTTNTTSVAYIDFLRVGAWIHPIYGPADFTAISTGTVTNDYTNVYSLSSGTSQVASDNNMQTVATNGASTPDFYYSFMNVETYTGMNSIIVRAEHACVNTGGTETYRAKIYNFNTTSWEALSSTITCSTTDATNIFAKNNVTVSDYISSGEVRVGFDAVANFASTDSITIDMIYLIMGSTNADSGASDCFISMGTLSSGSCTDTRTIDTTTTAAQWINTAAQESNTFGTAIYAFDSDNDINQEYGGSQWLNFPITKPDNAYLASIFVGGRFRSSVGGSVLLSMFDYSGSNQGVTSIGSTSNATAGATTTAVYSDPITLGTAFALSGCNATGTCQGINGFNIWPEDIVNTVSDKVFLRLRNSAPGASATNNELDFAFATIGWLETFPEYSVSGNIYQSGSESTLDTTAYTVALSVNNGTPVTTTASSGTYTFSGVTFSAGDQISVYIQGNASDANSISEVSASNQTINLYVDRTAIYHTYTDATTNSEVCGFSTYPGSGDNLFTCSTSIPTYTSGGVLVVDEYTPGGDVNSPSMKIMTGSTYTGGSETLTLSGSGTGTSRPFIVDGTFTATTNVVSYTGTSAVEVQATTYNDLYLYPASGTQTYTLGTTTSQTITINDDFLIGNGGTITVNHTTYDPALVIKGDMTLHSLAQWVASGTTKVTFSPTGTTTFTNNGTIDSIGDVEITGGTSTPKLNLASNMSASTVTIAASHTFDVNGSYTLTLYGTPAGTGVLSSSGTFTPSTGTVIYNGDGSININSGAITFYNLVFSPELTLTRSYNFNTGLITVNNDFTISPTSTLVNNNTLSSTIGTGIVVGGRTSISPSSTAYATLYTNGNPLTTGTIRINNSRGTLDGTDGGTITLTGTTGPVFDVSAGVFTEGITEVVFTGNGTFTASSGITDFYDLTLSPTITTNRTYTISSSSINANNITVNPTGSGGTYELQVDMANAVDVNGTLSITKNTSATSEWNTTGTNYALESAKIDILSGGTLTANGSTITLTGSSTPFNLSGGTFTAGTSNVVFNANSDINPMTAGTITFNNVTINPTLTLDRAYQFTSGSTISFTGDISVAPTASGTPYELTVDTGGVFSGSTSSDIDVNPSGTATVVFNTNVANYALTMQTITIKGSTTWESNASTITLTGASGLVFSDSGTHNSSSAMYVFNGDGDIEIDADTYDTLELSPVITSDRRYINQNGLTLSVVTALSIMPDAACACNLEFMLGDALDVSGVTTLDPSGDATANLDTQAGLDFSLTTGDLILVDTSTVETNRSLVDINGDLSISTEGTFIAPDSLEWTLAGDYTNYGIFTHTSSTLMVDGTGQQAFSGGAGSGMLDYSFYNLTILNNSGSDPVTSPSVIFLHGFTVDNVFSAEIANTKLRFQEGETFSILNGISINGQSPTTRVALRSSTSGVSWNFNVIGSTTVYNTDAKDSDANGGSGIDASDCSNYDSGGNNNWTFCSAVPTLTFSISDNTIGFGNLNSSGARYATGDTLGSGSETVAHTFDVNTNAASGYIVTVSGSTLTDGLKTIDAIGGTSAASSPGTEQFGIRVTASGGSGAVTSPYNHASNYVYDGVTVPDEVASASTGDEVTTTYSVRYLGNISSTTEAGSYQSTLTYIATGNF